MDQQNIDAKNEAFWNTLCGSILANNIGITDGSRQSLAKFDDWYLKFYPYLLDHVPVHEMRGKRVLEVGLGYGTLSEKIAVAGSAYSGLDIAAGPVAMVNSRLESIGHAGRAIQGNMLRCPFEDETFDYVVSIGCFHHTGNTQLCLDETFRVLKPGGRAFLMVYNQFSLRQWKQFPRQTFSRFVGDFLGASRLPQAVATQAQRAAYDADLNGVAAPETQFFSAKQIRQMMAKFEDVSCAKENADPFLKFPRSILLASVGPLAGLDIYVHAKKGG